MKVRHITALTGKHGRETWSSPAMELAPCRSNTTFQSSQKMAGSPCIQRANAHTTSLQNWSSVEEMVSFQARKSLSSSTSGRPTELRSARRTPSTVRTFTKTFKSLRSSLCQEDSILSKTKSSRHVTTSSTTSTIRLYAHGTKLLLTAGKQRKSA